jgi:hypothetical protein
MDVVKNKVKDVSVSGLLLSLLLLVVCTDHVMAKRIPIGQYCINCSIIFITHTLIVLESNGLLLNALACVIKATIHFCWQYRGLRILTC